MGKYTEQIRAGMKWLDENRPGWIAKISTTTLDMNMPGYCVLGQLARADRGGDYFQFVMDSSVQPIAMGFMLDITIYDDPDVEAEAWAELTDGWIDAICERVDNL